MQVTTKLRKVDVGELAEADYQPGRHLLGAFGYGGDKADISLSITRPAGYELPTVLVERAELITAVSASGRSQTAARFQLRSKAQMIEVRLPEGSTLWSAHFDGQPVLPQSEPSSGSVLINLPATSEALRRDLQLVYETPVNSIGLTSGLEFPAPQLFLRAEQDKLGEEVPMADLVWRLNMPGGYQVVRSGGTVFSEDIETRNSPVRVALRAVMEHSPFVSIQAARESRRRASALNRLNELERGLQDQHDGYGNLPAPADGSEPAAGATSEESGIVSEKAADAPSADADRKPIVRVEDLESPSEANQPTGEVAAELGDPSATATPPLAMGRAREFTSDLTAPFRKSSWALEGLRSLPIELQTDGVQTTFQSLGESPRLSVTIVDRRRFHLLAWAVALVIFARGVLLTKAHAGHRLRYVATVMVVALALPLALPWFEPLAPLCDMAFFAACWLAAYYLMAAIAKRFRRMGQFAGRKMQELRATLGLAGLLLLAVATWAYAEDPPVPKVKIPADAIIVPYDPAKGDPLQPMGPVSDGDQKNNPFAAEKTRQILVPYAKYVDLTKAANPAEIQRPTPAPFAFAGANFRANLDGGESLLVEGKLEIDLFVEHAVSVPIPLAGGALTTVTVDGQDKSASIGLAPAPPPQPPGKGQQAIPQPAEPSLMLVLAGRRRHRIDLAIRFPINRRGGWQIAVGRLPVAPAAALSLSVAKANTEVIVSGGVDRGVFETKRDDETLETALPADGTIHVQWRPKLGRAPVDQSLTARATAVLDVQEDGLRLVWNFDLAFRCRWRFETEPVWRGGWGLGCLLTGWGNSNRWLLI